MGRLSLVIADSDADYLAKFEKFLMVNYPQRFDIFSFSSSGNLSDFLSNPDKRDILLINSNMYKKGLQLKNIDAVILLSGDGEELIPEGVEAINKYQHAEKLVADILRLYAGRGLKACTMSGHSNTQIVCIYSPAGGTGKTSIAAGCSILCARRGFKTFYLNMEDVPSTSLFFHSESRQSFSNVIYHLKGKGKNLGLKLEGAKCCDSKTGVHFFSPPDSILEMEELTNNDVICLVNEFKSSASYDAVFIDMSCGLNQRNAAILGCVDVILMVLVPDSTSSVKMKELEAGFDMLKHKYGAQLTGRTVTIVNRNDERARSIGTAAFIDNTPAIEIGECISQETNRHAEGLVENVAFLSSLNRLLEFVLPQGATAATENAGGEFIA